MLNVEAMERIAGDATPFGWRMRTTDGGKVILTCNGLNKPNERQMQLALRPIPRFMRNKDGTRRILMFIEKQEMRKRQLIARAIRGYAEPLTHAQKKRWERVRTRRPRQPVNPEVEVVVVPNPLQTRNEETRALKKFNRVTRQSKEQSRQARTKSKSKRKRRR